MKVIYCTFSALWKRKNTKAEKKFSLQNEAPFLKERVDRKAANFVFCLGAASLRLEAVQSNGIARTKRNVLLYKGNNSKASQMESMQHISLSGERGGPTYVNGN